MKDRSPEVDLGSVKGGGGVAAHPVIGWMGR
jgi:hypothetical protein